MSSNFKATRPEATRVPASQVAEAVADVAEMTKDSSWPAPRRYNFAGVYALGGGKTIETSWEYADRAADALCHAVNAGFNDVIHPKNDPVLESVRGRVDFEKLVEAVEKIACEGREKAVTTSPLDKVQRAFITVRGYKTRGVMGPLTVSFASVVSSLTALR